MTGLEIFLVIIGLIIVIASFVFSEHLQAKKTVVQDDISNINIAAVSKEKIKEQIDDTVNTLIDDTIERTETMLDKVTNEKIIAVSEYSDKVIEEINRSHNEVMFLYNMLNDKELTIKNTIKEIHILNEGIQLEAQEKSILENLALENENENVAAEENVQQSNNELILEMYQQEKSIIQIAKELGLGIGEVRLVIDLYNASK